MKMMIFSDVIIRFISNNVSMTEFKSDFNRTVNWKDLLKLKFIWKPAIAIHRHSERNVECVQQRWVEANVKHFHTNQKRRFGWPSRSENVFILTWQRQSKFKVVVWLAGAKLIVKIPNISKLLRFRVNLVLNW